MTLTKPMLPDIVLTLLAGHWPEGDEDAMRRVADEWDAMAKALDELSEPADNAMKTTLASIDGKIHNAMTTFWQEIGGDAGALKGMIDACNSMQEGLEKGATDIEHAKWTIYGGLAASIAMFFIPGPTQALAAASARIFLRGVIAKLIARLAATGSVTLAKRLMVIAESRALEFAVGGATIGAIQGAGIDLAAQGIEYGLGHRDGIDLGSAALGAVTGAAGGAVGGVVTGGVTPIVQHGLAHATGQDAANIASSKLGSYTVDVVSETVAAVPGNVAGAAAAYPFTGQYDDSSIHEGMAGGVISRGGREPHPKGGGDHSDVAPEIDPNTVLTTAAVQVPAPDHAQPPAQLVATGEIAADQPRTNAAGTVDSVTQAGAQPVLEKAAQGAISDADAHQTPGGTVT
ncbi:MAG: hypothetical protein HOQ24_04300, partial [Mycobacteriaceae bacterium]|nr:hypothetical protein [Mycobacteriaceae bacterium]